jgi:hypothetical protein
MLSFRNSTGTGNAAASVRDLASLLNMQPPISLQVLIATKEITEFHRPSMGILTVGSPKGPVRRTAEGSYIQPYSFGSIIKPANTFSDVGDRFTSP